LLLFLLVSQRQRWPTRSQSCPLAHVKYCYTLLAKSELGYISVLKFLGP